MLPVRGHHARRRLPPRERLRQAVCGPVYRYRSRLKLHMAFRKQLVKGEERDPVEKTGNPCSNVLVKSYLTLVSEEQKRVGVQQ